MSAHTFSFSSSLEKLDESWMERCNHPKFMRPTDLIFEFLPELPLMITNARLRLIL